MAETYLAASKWMATAEDHPPLRPVNYVLAPLGAAGVLVGRLWLGPVTVVLSSLLLFSAGVWFLIDGITDVMVFRRLS
ncbi:hypothetical protein AB0H92_27735 [Streptomyces phaeochromogenes]|uniref:hypothetical protein n=1 Tax=Streptomyces phaeochromogenes TaxID=1923 RepID=UPI0033F25606